ncbi:MAG: hypothetical protein WBF13_10840 [Candidatus Zixiibacteriota bacterium]
MAKGHRITALLVIITVVTILIIILLVCCHKSTEVEIELTAERVDFAILNPLGTDHRIPLVRSLTISSLALSNSVPVKLRVDELYDMNDLRRPLLTKGRVIIRPTDQRFSRLTLKGRSLSLTELDVFPYAKVTVAVSEDGSINVWAHPDSMTSYDFPVVQGVVSIIDTVEASVERCVITDENGKVLFTESPQRRFLIDLGLIGENLVYRSSQTTFLSMRLFDGSRLEDGKMIHIYDPADSSWTAIPSDLPVSLPNAVVAVVNQKIHVVGGSHTFQGSNETKLLNSNLDVACLGFLKPSLEHLSRRTTAIKEGSITFPNGESSEISLKSEFVQFEEGDRFKLVSTRVENCQLRLLLAGRPKSILVGFQQNKMSQKLPTLLNWLYANQNIATVTLILLYGASYIIGLITGIRTLVSDSRKIKDENKQG